MFGFTTANVAKVKAFIIDLAVHAAFGGAGAALGYVGLHLDQVGISGAEALIVGGFIGSLVSRLQAKAQAK